MPKVKITTYLDAYQKRQRIARKRRQLLQFRKRVIRQRLELGRMQILHDKLEDQYVDMLLDKLTWE
jgi:hypothetical protein